MPEGVANRSVIGVTASQRCEACGYDLRGLIDCRCPECGLAFEPTARPTADLPWLRRRTIGTFGGYWRTVWLVLGSPGRLADLVWRDVDVDARDAQRFRRITIMIGVASAFALVALGLARAAGAASILVAIPVAVTAWLFLELATWFRDASFVPYGGGRRDRFRLLHDFTCAPLALLPAAPLLAWPGVVLDVPLLPVVGLAVFPLVGLAWTASTLMFHHRGGNVDPLNLLVHAFVLWLFWCLCVGFSVIAGVAVGVTVAMIARAVAM